jgi:hypothetical protein
MTWSPLLEKVASKSFELVMGKLLDAIKDEVTSEVRVLENRLEGIEGKIDSLLAMPLKAGFFSLRAGDLVGAQRQLAEACAADAYGAVARFWLGYVLAQRGRLHLAAEKIGEALLINPFVTSNTRLAHRLLTGIREIPTLTDGLYPWTFEFKDRKFLRPLQGSWLWHMLGREAGPMVQASIISASFSGVTVVVQWNLGVDLTFRTLTYVSALNSSNGTCMWTKALRHQTLCFSSAKYVVNRSEKQPLRYELLSANTGEAKARLTSQHLEAVFCPGISSLNTMQDFRDSNCTMTGARVAWKNASNKPAKSLVLHFLKTGQRHVCVPWQEERTLRDVFDSGSRRIIVTNRWSHFRNQLQPIGGPPGPPYCATGCEATVGSIR